MCSTVLNIDSNTIIKMFLEQQWFQKDHVTMKTEVMMLKFSFKHRNKIHLYYIQIEICYFKIKIYFTILLLLQCFGSN